MIWNGQGFGLEKFWFIEISRRNELEPKLSLSEVSEIESDLMIFHPEGALGIF